MYTRNQVNQVITGFVYWNRKYVIPVKYSTSCYHGAFIWIVAALIVLHVTSRWQCYIRPGGLPVWLSCVHTLDPTWAHLFPRFYFHWSFICALLYSHRQVASFLHRPKLITGPSAGSDAFCSTLGKLLFALLLIIWETNEDKGRFLFINGCLQH